jgi:hypothetical protein
MLITQRVYLRRFYIISSFLIYSFIYSEHPPPPPPQRCIPECLLFKSLLIYAEIDLRSF